MTTHDDLPPGGPPPTIDRKRSMKPPPGSRDIFFAAVETTRMPMLVTDPNLPDNPIVFANPAFLQMTGYSAEEVLGCNCRLLQGPETDRETIGVIREAVAQREELSVDILNYRKNGSAFWNALFMAPVYGDDGSLVYFFASQLDITRRREAEDALRHAQKMEALGQLTGGIAHDFNNLLQVVLGYGDSLAARIERSGDERSTRDIRAIMGAAERGATLTQQLLAFARKQRLDGRLINLHDLLRDVLPLVERTVGEGVSIRRPEPRALPNVKIDAVQAEMALLNIAANARDAMADGGELRFAMDEVTVREGDGLRYGELEPARYVELAVSDTGEGMSEDVRARVLEPFFTTKDQGKGTGLGLSMVYGFAKQSGGTVRVESKRGEGSTIRLYFPVAEEEGAKSHGRARRSVDERRGSETVLVVEDQPDVRALAASILSDFGYQVLTAGDAAEALEVLGGGARVDLLFSDLIMPGGMNGVTLARTARREQPRLKVLLTTGYAEASLERMDMRGAEFELIQKPYRRGDLVGRVRQVLDGPTGVG